VLPGGLDTPIGVDLAQYLGEYIDRTGNEPTVGYLKGPKFYSDGVIPEALHIGPGLGQPVNVANVVLFLASDEAAFVNGSDLVVDNAATIAAT
jgi:NAD(P)-dependent dehydrogenase (short-subunit alcohol dehydrogenase family)